MAAPEAQTTEELKAGDAVEAIGLTEAGLKGLNGQVGTLIKRYSKKNGGRLEVRFTENGKPKIVGLDPENGCVPGGAESLREQARVEKEKKVKEDKEKTTRGRYVEVFGLTSEKGQLLNGQRGIVIKKTEATGRIEVCLKDKDHPEGKLTALKPECFRLVTGASATETENAKELAFPHLKAAMDEFRQQAAQPAATATSSSPQQAGDFGQSFELDRSWSPPPEIRNAASAAALQAASLASSRGYHPQQAEAYGSAAAEKYLEAAKAHAAALKAQAAQAPRVVPGVPVVNMMGAHPGMIPGMIPGMVHGMPGMVHGMVPGMVGMTMPGMQYMAAAAAPIPPPPSTPREEPKTVEDSKIGDCLEAFGLKGDDAALNNDKGTITNILGWSGKTKRYHMSFTQFIIDDNGDLGEKKRNLILTPTQLRIPGTGPADGADGDGDRADGADSSSRSRSRRKRKKGKRSRSPRRKGKSFI